MTAAYKNGVVYVASGDMHAYAVTTSGGLKWKSSKLPGDGFQSYWPVVFTDPTTQKDLVVFSGASGYRWDTAPGYAVRWKIMKSKIYFYDKSTSSDTPLATSVSVNEGWAAGKNGVELSRGLLSITKIARRRARIYTNPGDGNILCSIPPMGPSTRTIRITMDMGNMPRLSPSGQVLAMHIRRLRGRMDCSISTICGSGVGKDGSWAGAWEPLTWFSGAARVMLLNPRPSRVVET